MSCAARGLIDEVVTLPPGVTLEGAGDCLWDAHRRLFWMGCGFRSGVEAREVVARNSACRASLCRWPIRAFYHLDTCFSPLPCGAVMYYPAAFTTEALALIHARVAPEQRIALSPDDAACFAANAVSFGRVIVLSSCSETLRARLRERGYTVVETPLTGFQRSGGSACCLTLRLDHRVGCGHGGGACRESCAQKVTDQRAFHRTTMASSGLLRDLFWSDDECPLITQSGHFVAVLRHHGCRARRLHRWLYERNSILRPRRC